MAFDFETKAFGSVGKAKVSQKRNSIERSARQIRNEGMKE